MRRWPLLTAAALLVTACATQQTEPETPAEAAQTEPPAKIAAALKPERSAPVGRPAELEALLAEFQRLRRLSPAELVREQEAARQAFNQTRTELARVQFAMALTVPGGAPGEEARALELLDPLVKNQSATLHGVAFLIAAYIQEQRRLVAQIQGLQQNNKELQQNVQGMQQNVQGLQQNVQGLQQKLDALRTLERSLTERREPAPKRR